MPVSLSRIIHQFLIHSLGLKYTITFISNNHSAFEKQLKGWEHNRLMSNFSPVFDFARICPNFCSPRFKKHFAVLQSCTKLLEKTKHEQRKNHLLTISLLLILPQNFTSLSHPLPLCNDNWKQMEKPLTYCFSLRNSTTVTSPSPPPPYAMLIWKVMLIARRLFMT